MLACGGIVVSARKLLTGPLLVNDGSGFVLTGVVSFGFGCNRAGFPSVYARVGA